MRQFLHKRGAALMAAMIVTMIIFGVTVAYLAEAKISHEKAQSAMKRAKAHHIADTGLEYGRKLATRWRWDSGSFNDLLAPNQPNAYPAAGVPRYANGPDLSRPEVGEWEHGAVHMDYLSNLYPLGGGTGLFSPEPVKDPLSIYFGVNLDPGVVQYPDPHQGKEMPSLDPRNYSEAMMAYDIESYIGYRPVFFGDGFFGVFFRDNNDDGDPFKDSDDVIIIRAVGFYSGQIVRMEALAHYVQPEPTYVLPNAALITDGNSGGNSASFIVSGTVGSLHSNGNIDFNNGNFSGDISSAGGTVTLGSGVNVGGVVDPHAAAAPMPGSNPRAYLQFADLIADVNPSTGVPVIRAGPAHPTATPGSVLGSPGQVGTPWDKVGFDQVAGVWDVGRNAADGHTWFFRGSLRLNTTSGNGAIPNAPGPGGVVDEPLGFGGPGGGGPDNWNGTFIVTGDVYLNGGAQVDPNTHGQIPSVQAVIGGDLRINGNADTGVEAIWLVNEQLRVLGTSTTLGAVLSVDRENLHSGVSNTGGEGDDAIYINGNYTITYNGGLGGLLPSDVEPYIEFLSWRLRGGSIPGDRAGIEPEAPPSPGGKAGGLPSLPADPQQF